jgi:hypothetical protein
LADIVLVLRLPLVTGGNSKTKKARGGEKMKNWSKFIEENTINCEAGWRGGGIAINVKSLFPKIDDARMGAHQNYLGGGLLGAVVGGASFEPSELTEKQQKTFYELKEAIKRYYHKTTNDCHEGDCWSQTSYEQNQNYPVSAY